MLDPESRPAAHQEILDQVHRLDGACLIEVEGGHALEQTVLGEVVEIAAQHDRPGLDEVDEEHLMTRRVSGGRLDHDGLIAEHIVVTIEQDGLRRLQVGVQPPVEEPLRILERGLMLRTLDQPRRAGKHVRIPGMVIVHVRERQVRDVRRGQIQLVQLRRQRRSDSGDRAILLRVGRPLGQIV